ncbi:conjugal transfer protein TraW [Sphingomonas sp. MG17]|uniref:Conjugal transfer protein TraW n=1 Tax=Sphingomonas tagetis TaxID=2949092 RepID=A0A9X2HSF7_9SPHN|nr:conjugal transfer protein TraW [Sphingomonas tagetis]MCP3732754.1 conjugal transfer protein TraW [Sphingomonas tagetis]
MAGDPATRWVAIAQGALVAGLLAGAALLGLTGAAASPAQPGSTATIGRTWPIAEPDAMAEIAARVARQPKDMAAQFGPRSNWSALRAAALGIAPADRTRDVVPFYTLDTEIRLPDGKLLYPKGFSFNPLAYVKLPQRLVIAHPRDLGWALAAARPADFVIVTAGDAIELSERTGRAIYILEERMKDRLGLTVAPVIVAQAGQKLVLTEFGPRQRGMEKALAR